MGERELDAGLSGEGELELSVPLDRQALRRVLIGELEGLAIGVEFWGFVFGGTTAPLPRLGLAGGTAEGKGTRSRV